MARLKIHPVCNVFPDITGAEFSKLKDDIWENGQREPIVIHDGFIVDGKNRFRACEELGMECNSVEWDGKGDSLVSWAVSKNLHRRHLTSSQRAAVAAELTVLYEKEADARKKAGTLPPIGGKVGTAASQAAKSVGASERSTERVARIKEADPQKFEQVKAGEKSAAAAEREIRDEQLEPFEAGEIFDYVGHALPEKFHGPFCATDFDEMCSAIQAVRRRLKAFCGTPTGAHLHFQTTDIELKNAYHQIKNAKPYSLCGYCRSRGCKACNKRGWIPKIVFDAAPPEVQEAEF